MNTTRAITLLGCGLTLAACVNLEDNPTGPRVDPIAALATARSNLQEATLQATQQGLRAARVEEHFAVARFNQARCQCPPFEVLTAGVWTRSWLIWNPPGPEGESRLAAVENKARDFDVGPLYLVRGRFLLDRQTAPNEIEYPVVQISYIGGVGHIAPEDAQKLARTYDPSDGVPSISAQPLPDPVKTVPDENGETPSDEPNDAPTDDELDDQSPNDEPTDTPLDGPTEDPPDDEPNDDAPIDEPTEDPLIDPPDEPSSDEPSPDSP